MNKTSISQIKIKEATAHNLKNIDVQIPHQSLTVITGVSGSGKSSLAYSVLFKESQRRFLSSFSAHSRQFLAKMEKPKVAQISGLQAALAIPQKTTTSHARSTVGTLSGVYDYLRLLFSRVGANPQQLQAKAFSFSSKIGACVHCNGLGVKEQIDVKKLLADENLSIAQGALVPTTPNGYIVYSQVRVDELNKVCQAHDFSVDIPWKSLSKAQQDVIWYGSNRVKILFGKHGLESRLKWKGITAKPREEAYYKGMIPIMEDILHRDRNENILRFASSFVCDNCLGARLNKEALKVKIQDQNIYQLSQLPIDELHLFLNMLLTKTTNKEVISSILEPLLHRLEYLQLLGLEYLSLERTAASLSSGEAQRIRLAAQLGGDLQNILYVLDEPSVGLHARDTEKLIRVLKTLRDQGNTVVVVEHEEEIIRAADYLIDMGPKAGLKGGEVLFQGSAKLLLGQENKYPKSLTAHYLKATGRGQIKKNPRKGKALISISGASKNNLKSIDTQFKVGAFNVVTGVSGAGKSSLVNGVLAQSIKNKTSKKVAEHISGLDSFQGLILVDQSPIGRSSRSIPATYTDVFDHIRTLFAAQALSKERKYKKGQFSFNNKGGRCETCEGVGKIEHKMHLLGNVDIICHHCHGKRFKQETLEVKYKDKNIADILELSINQAYEFFQEEVKITRILKQLIRLDVGYLKLGQSSTTLSGGEAQRIKLAAELYKTSKASKLYILDEPTLGLHKADIAFLLQALNQIVDDGHTVIVIEHDMDIIIQSDWIVDLGPNGGEKGGELIAQASPKDFIKHEKSYTAQALLNYGKPIAQTTTLAKAENKNKAIHFSGLNTHNLKNIEVEIPLNEITLITGVSGSGKSSLAFDSIFAESRSRYTESLSTYARRMMPKVPRPDLEQCHGLTPSVALEQKRFAKNARSTVGTFSEIYDLYRLLFSRIGQSNSPQKHSASYFSFNNKEASCAYCQGMGVHTIADTKKYITHPNKSLILGALDGTNTGRFFGDPYGQYVATLKQLAQEKGIDYSRSFSDLSEQEKEIALYGTGDTIYEVDWQYKRGKNKGSLQLKTPWKGFSNLIKEEYELRKGGKRGDSFIPLMSEIACPKCQGQRLKDSVLEVQVAQQNIAQLSKLSVEKSIDFFLHLKTKLSTENYLISEQIIGQVLNKLQAIKNLGLAYLNIDRNTASLSGGEAQRLRLASQLFFGLQGLTYILDEPSIGLHTHDTKNLIEHLYKLKEKGNTIIMVEHDADLLKIADNIIEMGPGAGKLGGHIIAQGKLNV
ncbi:MAG: excinuclease ABC subunit A [Bacteroidetes bacterium 4572_77]|nr:MAG: excinuclease ABC subunit A [Bacteroidetes bacterium 4572_77]